MPTEQGEDEMVSPRAAQRATATARSVQRTRELLEKRGMEYVPKSAPPRQPFAAAVKDTKATLAREKLPDWAAEDASRRANNRREIRANLQATNLFLQNNPEMRVTTKRKHPPFQDDLQAVMNQLDNLGMRVQRLARQVEVEDEAPEEVVYEGPIVRKEVTLARHQGEHHATKKQHSRDGKPQGTYIQSLIADEKARSRPPAETVGGKPVPAWDSAWFPTAAKEDCSRATEAFAMRCGVVVDHSPRRKDRHDLLDQRFKKKLETYKAKRNESTAFRRPRHLAPLVAQEEEEHRERVKTMLHGIFVRQGNINSYLRNLSHEHRSTLLKPDERRNPKVRLGGAIQSRFGK